mmetsp:Transcript_107704/g.170025  ORF Transcript_107704/g.170025 Transcript_107704/m.170025 type:complete len:376 (+) Transcript_107704:43-1170(+)
MASMSQRCYLLFVACSVEWYTTAFGARLNMRSPVEEEVHDLVMFEEPQVTNLTSESLFGCEKAVKLVYGTATATGSEVFAWECLRCKPGYIEGTKLITVPSKYLAQFKNIKGSIEQKGTECRWKPGGSLCAESAATTSLKQRALGGHDLSCVQCPVLFGRARFVDTNIPTVHPGGTRVNIKRICSATEATDASHWTPDTLLTLLLSMFAKPLTLVPLELALVADEFRISATRVFLSDASTDAEKRGKDMVGDGGKFMRKEIERGIDGFRAEQPERLIAIAHAFVESWIVQDMRGTLDLCFSIARHDMDGTERDEKLVQVAKRCRSTDYVFETILHIFCTGVIESKKCDVPYTDYASVGEAPQRTLEILRMFGAIE